MEMEKMKIKEMREKWKSRETNNGENGVVRKLGVEMKIGENEIEAEKKTGVR